MVQPTDGQPIRSVLYDVQARQGGSFQDFDGWIWTLDLGDTPGEYEAIRSGAAMWDVYALTKWEVVGPDAGAAIQRVFTRDLTTQQVGQVRYGAFCDGAGQLLDEGTVFKVNDEHYFVFTNGHEFSDHLTDWSTGLSVAIADLTHEMPLISVQGPKSREILQSLTDVDLSAMPYFRFTPTRVVLGGVLVWLSHTGFSGELGFELVVSPADAEQLWLTLADAGVRPVGSNAVEIARIEAGLIIYLFDYEPGQRTPYDLGLDRMVATTSDAVFLGKEPLAALAAEPPNRFKTLLVGGDQLPEYGADVLHDGVVVGTLTSPTNSPRFGQIGLAVVPTALAANGTKLDVVLGDTTVSASVDELSIYDPEKLKPRG
jgi:aminomethyltransferase